VPLFTASGLRLGLGLTNLVLFTSLTMTRVNDMRGDLKGQRSLRSVCVDKLIKSTCPHYRFRNLRPAICYILKEFLPWAMSFLWVVRY